MTNAQIIIKWGSLTIISSTVGSRVTLNSVVLLVLLTMLVAGAAGQTKRSWGIYRSPDVAGIAGGPNSPAVYGGTQTVVAMTAFKGGVVTAFSSGGVYRSPDGRNLGGGGNTELVNNPSYKRVAAMIPYKTGVIIAFYDPSTSRGQGIYYSPDGRNVEGGGSTVRVYSGYAMVDAIVPYKDGVITAFFNSSGVATGIYYSPDGNNLGGGGSTVHSYAGAARVDEMIPYTTTVTLPNSFKVTTHNVITAFYNNANRSGAGIYRSPDGLYLGGGGNTVKVYDASYKRVDKMLVYNGSVFTAFFSSADNTGAGIYRSPDGLNLGGGGSTTRVYDASAKRVTRMVAFQNGVVTAFHNPVSMTGQGIYFSPDGNYLGGGGSTTRVYVSEAIVGAMVPNTYTYVRYFRDGTTTTVTQNLLLTSYYVVNDTLSAKEKCRERGGVWVAYGLGSHCSKILGSISGAANQIGDVASELLLEALPLDDVLVWTYKGYFSIVGSNTMKRELPPYVQTKLLPYFSSDLLKRIHYASTDHVGVGGITDCTDIYFPSRSGAGMVALIRDGETTLFKKWNGQLVNKEQVDLLIHEITHAQQCDNKGSRYAYGEMWWKQLTITTLEDVAQFYLSAGLDWVSSKEIHDKMPMEANAKENAARIVSLLTSAP